MFRYSVLKNYLNSSKDVSSEANSQKTRNSLQQNTISDDIILVRRGYILPDDVNNILGEGTYSKVKRAYSKYHKTDVAVKILIRKKAPDDFLRKFLPRELEIIGHINHENIVRYYEVIDTTEKIFIVMQHATGGDLLEYIQKSKFMKEESARNMFLQIVSAVSYLHNINILHRDLKCENILLTKDLKPLLSDFGFAKHLPDIKEPNKTYCGSSAYAPLEILKGIPYDGRASEVWSLGVILFIIITGSMPFDDSNKAEQIKQMIRGPSFIRSKQFVNERLKSLILTMLDNDPLMRLNLDQVRNHSWMQCPIQPSTDSKKVHC